jgi:hypothetical protein
MRPVIDLSAVSHPPRARAAAACRRPRGATTTIRIKTTT